jgi:hypothetical protein
MPPQRGNDNPLLLHPTGWDSFHLLQQIRNRDFAPEITQDVHVILRAVDDDRRAFDLLKNASHVGMPSFATPARDLSPHGL